MQNGIFIGTEKISEIDTTVEMLKDFNSVKNEPNIFVIGEPGAGQEWSFIK